MKNVLTIAGSDSCGGAGIQADLKTFAAHKVYGLSVITAITAQNTQKVISIEGVNPSVVKDQLNALSSDIHIHAVKIGMLYSQPIIEEVASFLHKHKHIKNIVLDPLMISSSGRPLLNEDAVETLIKELFPLVDLITPNLEEAGVLTNNKINKLEEVYKSCRILKKMGCKNVLIKGGHFEYDAVDVLYDGQKFYEFSCQKLNQKHTHGTGCTLSSAIAANLAKGMSMEEAIKQGKFYITEAIRGGFLIGKGPGVLDHFLNRQEEETHLKKQSVQISECDKPLIHFLTNQVTINDVANVAIAMGVSPMMAQADQEIEEVIEEARFSVINTGTVDEARFLIIEKAMKLANQYKVPILLDPVGCATSTYRKEWVKKLLETYSVTILKVNGSEGKALLGKSVHAKGVDSELLSKKEAEETIRLLSKKYQCIVVMTGETDYIADGTRVSKVEGGSRLLQLITGSGCMLNSVIAAFVVNERDAIFEAAIKGLMIMKKAAESANKFMQPYEGPMAFKKYLIDSLYHLRNSEIKTL